jgi:Do/DeqQ family serine protease
MRKSIAAAALFTCGALLSCRQFQSRTVSASSIQPASEKIAPAGPVVSYADTVDHVAPAVVTVHASRREKAAQQYPFSNDPLFRWFFGQPDNRQSPGASPQQDEVERALGSGVIVRSDGHILTNHHVVDGAQEISVDLADRRTFKAKLIGSDKPSDLAVLKIDAGNLPVLALGDSDKVRVGDICLAVGNPLGIGETVTAGIISAKGRETGVSDGSFEDFLQTDAPINRGNSGGALVNTGGELIGISSQIVSASGGNIGIGFAIPSNMAKSVLQQLISTGKVVRGQLGVTVQYINSELAASLGLKEVKGVLISHVAAGGPADHAGLKEGDVILNLNGSAINDVNALRNKVASSSPGSDVTLTILRDGSQRQVRAKLGEFKPEGNSATPVSESGAGAAGKLGISVEPLTSELAREAGVPRNIQGLVVDNVDPAGAAADAGIQTGDVIEQINRQPVRSAGDIEPALKKSGNRPALVLIDRKGQTIYVPVTIG